MTSSNRRSFLQALPFLGAIATAPVMASTAPQAQESDLEAQLRQHADAIRRIVGGDVFIIAPIDWSQVRGGGIKFDPIEWWQEHVPENHVYLTHNREPVTVRFEGENLAGKPMVTVTTLDGDLWGRMLALHLPANISGRIF